jgi:thiol-disulfide isomerase/thioredoxin
LILSVACASALLIAMTDADIRAAQALPENLVLHSAAKVVPSIKFEDEAGQGRSLTDFKGKVVVLNIWATWCWPCRREMPMLDRLQAALGGPGFEVVPVSIDRGGIDVIRKFYADIGVRSLAMYVDRSGQILRDVGAVGLPTTLIVNSSGEEIGRIAGPAEWDSAEITEFLRPVIAKRNSMAHSSDQTNNAHVASADRPGAIQRGLQWLKALFGK